MDHHRELSTPGQIFEALEVKQKKIIRKAGIELMGEELFNKFLSDGAIVNDQVIQDKIDKKSIEFIKTNEGIKATEVWGDFANIQNMPQSTILKTQLAEIERLAKIILPKYWTATPPTL